MALFDEVIESARAGLRKPDPRIYALMADRLDVPPARCVYLDKGQLESKGLGHCTDSLKKN